MRLTLVINTTVGRRRLEATVERLQDLQPILRRFGAYLRARAKERFDSEGPGWQPLAQQTGHGLIHRRVGRVTRLGTLRETLALKRLRAQLRRDVRADRLDARVLGAFERATRSNGGGRLRQAVDDYVREQKYKGQLLRIAKELDRVQAGKLRSGKRAITRHHRLLGRLASTIRAQVKKNELLVMSIVDYAGIHNVGGEAGHRAHIPARTFLELEEADVDVLRDLILSGARDEGKRS